MGNSYKPRTYECKCGALTKEYVWDNELTKHKVKCESCSAKLGSKNLLKLNTNEAVSIRTPTKNR